MAISRLIINHFRNLTAIDLEFERGFNFIIGNNGSGKTSLLEAIFYLGHGRTLFYMVKFKSNNINGLLVCKNNVKVTL